MSEIVYCYTCNRGQPLDPAASPYRVCSVCKNDELGETVDPALTGGRVPAAVTPPVIRWEPAPKLLEFVPMRCTAHVTFCDRCNGAVDTFECTTGPGPSYPMCVRCKHEVRTNFLLGEGCPDFRARSQEVNPPRPRPPTIKAEPVRVHTPTDTTIDPAKVSRMDLGEHGTAYFVTGDTISDLLRKGVITPVAQPRPMSSLGSADYCKRCVGAVDTMFDVTGKAICMRCAANVEHRPMPENARDYRKSARSEVDHVRAPPEPRTYATLAAEVAATVERKNKAYGDSFAKVTRTLEDMFPNGIPVEAYADVGGIVRTLDKLFRVATDRDALEENPWGDIAGYALLAVRRVEQDKDRA